MLARGTSEAYPLMITSLSTPYTLACHVPQPSSNRLGTTFAKTPLSVGLLYKFTCTRSGKARISGRRASAVFSGPGLVDRK